MNENERHESIYEDTVKGFQKPRLQKGGHCQLQSWLKLLEGVECSCKTVQGEFKESIIDT